MSFHRPFIIQTVSYEEISSCVSKEAGHSPWSFTPQQIGERRERLVRRSLIWKTFHMRSKLAAYVAGLLHLCSGVL